MRRFACLLGLLSLFSVAVAGQTPVELSSARGLLCLNGTWRFQPAVGPADAAPSGAWGEALVPGSWSGTQCLPGLAKTATNAPWDTVPIGQVSRAWYERAVTVPAAWQGRAIVLELTRVSTDARVFCNGTECGRIGWPNGSVDLTAAVRPGQENLLRVLVCAVPQAKEAAAALAGGQATWQLAGSVDARGMVGEALLHSRPAGAHADGLTITTSVRQHRLEVGCGLAGVTQAGSARFTARLLGPDGKAEKTFTASADLKAGQTRVDLAWPWPDPRLWDVEQPNLYRLLLAIEAPGWRDEVTETFGFREGFASAVFHLNKLLVADSAVQQPAPCRANGASRHPLAQFIAPFDSYIHVPPWPDVPSPTVGAAFEQGRASTQASPFHGSKRSFMDFHNIVSVQADAGDFVDAGHLVQIIGRPPLGQVQMAGIEVILADEDHRQFVNGSQIH